MIRKKLIKSQVARLLARCNIDKPPVNVESIARQIGLKIRRQPAPAEISGCLIRNRDCTIIGINSTQHPNRQRFTIAHEIGHYFLHADMGESLHVDRVPAFSVSFRDETSSRAVAPDEIEANYFAAELLMPANFLMSELGNADVDLTANDSGDYLAEFAKKYAVSTQALTYRLINLGLLPAA